MPNFDSVSVKERLTKVNLGHKAEITIGGKDPSRVIPNVNAECARQVNGKFENKWMNQRPVMGEVDVSKAEGIVLDDDLVAIKTPGREDKYFLNPDKTLEHRIILEERPPNPWLEFDIKCSPDIRAEKQLALSVKDVAEGSTRPDDVVNSYAYMSGSKHNDHQTGKVAHDMRPFFLLPNGEKHWLDQDVKLNGDGTGWKKIPLPLELYNNWIPGTEVGPTLGYDTRGASTRSDRFWFFAAGHDMPAVGGLAATINAEINGTPDFTLGLYADAGDGEPGALIQYLDGGIPVSSKISQPITQTLAGSTRYYIFIQGTASNFGIKYDTTTGTLYRYKSRFADQAPFDPWQNSGGDSTTQLSLWLDYVASASGDTGNKNPFYFNKRLLHRSTRQAFIHNI